MSGKKNANEMKMDVQILMEEANVQPKNRKQNNKIIRRNKNKKKGE